MFTNFKTIANKLNICKDDASIYQYYYKHGLLQVSPQK